MNSNPVETDTYDRGIVPAETAARIEREGDNYKTLPQEEDNYSNNTAGGYTVDKEGLLNNYAVEPEMYIETPGDLQAELDADEAQRRADLAAINQTDEDGQLTMESDKRGKGVGVI